MGEKWIFDDYSYLYKGLTELLQETLATRKTRKAENSQRALKYFCEQIKKSEYTNIFSEPKDSKQFIISCVLCN